jgi:hypothetical protein
MTVPSIKEIPNGTTKLPDECARALALLEEILQSLPPDTPVLADLQAR